MLIDLIVGARPNFIKISSIIIAINKFDKKYFKYRLIHTGQHFDANMSEYFFNDLNLPKPDFNLNCGGGTHAEQTAKIMIEYEKILLNSNVDFVMVVGDVNSTLACTLVAKKMNIKVGHIEAGIRSNDRTMPEEINRVVTDSIADLFFTTSKNASKNLLSMGVDSKKIFFVGNTMIDTLINFKHLFKKPKIWNDLQLTAKKYFILTVHRPSNLSDNEYFKNLLKTISIEAQDFNIIFPVHPRTTRLLDRYTSTLKNFHIIEPLSYLEFNYLVEKSIGVITDSGGISEETTILNIPCITLRDSTERPETVSLGTNVIIGKSIKCLQKNINLIKKNSWKTTRVPQLWDGKSGERIVNILKDNL